MPKDERIERIQPTVARQLDQLIVLERIKIGLSVRTIH